MFFEVAPPKPSLGLNALTPTVQKGFLQIGSHQDGGHFFQKRLDAVPFFAIILKKLWLLPQHLRSHYVLRQKCFEIKKNTIQKELVI